MIYHFLKDDGERLPRQRDTCAKAGRPALSVVIEQRVA